MEFQTIPEPGPTWSGMLLSATGKIARRRKQQRAAAKNRRAHGASSRTERFSARATTAPRHHAARVDLRAGGSWRANAKTPPGGSLAACVAWACVAWTCARVRGRFVKKGLCSIMFVTLLGRPGSDLLSRVLRRSTIGSGAFHGRVRNGIGCSHPDITTRSAKERDMFVCARRAARRSLSDTLRCPVATGRLLCSRGATPGVSLAGGQTWGVAARRGRKQETGLCRCWPLARAGSAPSHQAVEDGRKRQMALRWRSAKHGSLRTRPQGAIRRVRTPKVSESDRRPARRAHNEHCLMRAIKSIELLVPVSYTLCSASTPGLSTWWSSTTLEGELVLRWVSRLDAFSVYPVHT
jgi:hypothetical protein